MLPTLDTVMLLGSAAEQLEGADNMASNASRDLEPATRALVGIGQALLVIAQELTYLRMTVEERNA